MALPLYLPWALWYAQKEKKRYFLLFCGLGLKCGTKWVGGGMWIKNAWPRQKLKEKVKIVKIKRKKLQQRNWDVKKCFP